MKTKQVIIIRKDLNMRKGKMVAQGSHASLGVILNEIYKQRDEKKVVVEGTWTSESPFHSWLLGAFKKICVSVDSEQELYDLKEIADELNIPNLIIIDSGLTEFNGVPTATCMAIGPAEEVVINQITGHLKLL
jgi:PTH2 family peptidyl-tRNA hydrolase